MAKVILFGTRDTAELAYYYLKNDSPHEVIAFCVNKKFKEKENFKGLPVVNFEEIQHIYPPKDFSLFAPMTAKKMNKIREYIYIEGKSKGYDFISYVSSKATVFNSQIGENCFILENNTLQPFTQIGNNVILWSGNHIGHHGIIRDHVFFSSHVVMSGNCTIESYCFFGVNATIRDFSHISEGTLLAMGSSLVSKKTESWGVYIGNPAKKQDKLSYEIY